MNYFSELGLMLLGALSIIVLKAAIKARNEGNKFRLRRFVRENLTRIYMIFICILVLAAIVTINAEAVETIFQIVPLGQAFVRGIGGGAALAGFVLLFPENKT
jgi:hypothetical protein